MQKQQIKKVAVIGAGFMGAGIALEFARFGHDVSIYNRSEATGNKAMGRIKEDLELMAETGLIKEGDIKAALGRLHPTTSLEQAAAGADYVLESAVELLSLKQDIFARLDEICPPPAVLATNTSTLRITDIAARTKHPERILATHYFHPPHLIPMVEVVGGEKTAPAVKEFVADVLRGMHKRPAVLNLEIPNFVGNRLQGVIGQEVQSLIDKGMCTPEMMDDIICYGIGRRMPYTGFFRRLDMSGLDFFYTIAKERGRQPWGPLAAHVEKGELGVKTGKGFYDWPPEFTREFYRKLDAELIRMLKQDLADGRI